MAVPANFVYLDTRRGRKPVESDTRREGMSWFCVKNGINNFDEKKNTSRGKEFQTALERNVNPIHLNFAELELLKRTITTIAISKIIPMIGSPVMLYQ